MNFEEVFPKKKSIIGMIHLAGRGPERISRALEELTIYQDEGLDGAIVENYHGHTLHVSEVLKQSQEYKIIRGVNVLGGNYSALHMAQLFGARFVQLDTVIGNEIISELYKQMVGNFPEICILGGVRFKYIPPTGKSLEEDIKEGIGRCDAIVTTGEGTGIETPIDKLKNFKKIMGNFPLIVGAGVNLKNVCEQLKICDGAIVGSYFKNGDTYQKVDRNRVRDFMQAVKALG